MSYNCSTLEDRPAATLSQDVISSVAVVGIGNILMSDDGLGVHAVRELRKHDLPENVTCIDGGTASFEAVDACTGCDEMLVIDAVQAGGKPGTIYRMSIEQWQSMHGISLHDVTLLDALSMSEISTGRNIPVTVIGMEPYQITPGLELSQPVRDKFNEFIEHILERIKS